MIQTDPNSLNDYGVDFLKISLELVHMIVLKSDEIILGDV